MTDLQEPQEGWNTPDIDDIIHAVIEAARKVMKHVSISEFEGEQGTLTEISLFADGIRQYWHEDMAEKTLWEDDDFITAVIALSAALDAYDESEDIE